MYVHNELWHLTSFASSSIFYVNFPDYTLYCGIIGSYVLIRYVYYMYYQVLLDTVRTVRTLVYS